jgi:hypothetical protein
MHYKIYILEISNFTALPICKYYIYIFYFPEVLYYINKLTFLTFYVKNI